MKTYFTKYLPVEGEIKDGERGWSINNALYTHYEYLGKSYGKPVKLFLCSRDIQDHDNCIYMGKYKGVVTRSIHGKSIWVLTDGEGNHHIYADDLDNLIKVIGEISSGAIWVKENQEFEEEEIKCGPTGVRTHTEENPDGTFDATYEFRKIIKIKCPTCKNYH